MSYSRKESRMIARHCVECATLFHVSDSRYRQGPCHFCSTKCQRDAILGLSRAFKSQETRDKIGASKSGPRHHFWGKHFSVEHRKNLSEANKASHPFGSKNPNWKGGRKRQADRQVVEYKDWRKAVLARDNRTCVRCGDTPTGRKMLHTHHIKSFIGFPELRWDVSNGMTLCKKCHHREHKWLTKEEKLCAD